MSECLDRPSRMMHKDDFEFLTGNSSLKRWFRAASQSLVEFLQQIIFFPLVNQLQPNPSKLRFINGHESWIALRCSILRPSNPPRAFQTNYQQEQKRNKEKMEKKKKKKKKKKRRRRRRKKSACASLSFSGGRERERRNKEEGKIGLVPRFMPTTAIVNCQFFWKFKVTSEWRFFEIFWKLSTVWFSWASLFFLFFSFFFLKILCDSSNRRWMFVRRASFSRLAFYGPWCKWVPGSFHSISSWN